MLKISTGASPSTHELTELATAGFVTGRNTFYKEIYRVQAGEFVKINTHTSEHEYFNYYSHYRHATDLPNEVLLHKLDLVVTDVFQRLIDSVQGRTIVVLLSGGYDSRLVVTSLKRLNYKNVICISFGTDKDKDFVVAREIASKMGYNFIPVKVDRHYWHNKAKAQELDGVLHMSKEIGGISHFHLGSIVKDLITEGILPESSVFVTGQSGDAIEGEDIIGTFYPDKVNSKEEICHAIIERHFYLSGTITHDKNIVEKAVLKCINDYPAVNEKYNEEEAESIAECFNWRERQSKYVVSDCRNYDEYSGAEWRLPLWDNAFVEFWESVPYQLYKKRNLYFQYVMKQKLPTANTSSIYRNLVDGMKRNMKPIIKLLYPIKAYTDYWFSKDLFFATLGGITFKEYRHTIYLTKGYRNTPTQYYLYKVFGDQIKKD